MRCVWNPWHKEHSSKPKLYQHLSIGTPRPAIDLDQYSLAQRVYNVWIYRQDCTVEIFGELNRVHPALFIHSEVDSVVLCLGVPELP
jgi:hypothetical protein